MKKCTLTLCTLLALGTQNVFANESMLKQKLSQLGATNIQISDSPLPNFKTAVTDQGILQISENGQFILQGDLYEVTNKGVTNITNKPLLKELNQLEGEMIIYSAKNPKHVVTVFTDISCHYCQKLHNEIKEYNDLGITIRYLAYPRNGLNSQIAKQMEAVWTAEDRQFSLTNAKQGTPPKEGKTAKLIKKHYELGGKFGVRGTPSMVTESGEFIGGYLPPKELLKALNEG